MMFIKKIPDILPELKINDIKIKWVRSFKYLGLTLDASTLTWKDHIREIKRCNIEIRCYESDSRSIMGS